MYIKYSKKQIFLLFTITG